MIQSLGLADQQSSKVGPSVDIFASILLNFPMATAASPAKDYERMNSAFTKDQVEAIVLYMVVAVLIGTLLFLAVCYVRRRRKAKLHDTAVAERRDVESDSS